MKRHPCCLTCYENLSEGMQPLQETEGFEETCCFCGKTTKDGAWFLPWRKPEYCTAPDGDHGEG